ncbi:A/G-specific adenine glycosylase [Candidatus Saccharibacteria bacterium]|nr:A/G-specific adenine glycosylase [Candidatus Saccharibacteria bacterium]
MNNDEFRRLIHQKGEEMYRDMPWRIDTRPYYVLVSELMLQQTQVDRVIPKFEFFIEAFPTERALAQASLADVLKLWQGLGYNRRAKFLHESAKMIIDSGGFPKNESGLMALPGVGKNTAGAIMAYVYNQPALFVETNVRAVYIHHFFDEQDIVDDKDIYDLLAQTIDIDHPRIFYWAIMDYGTWLKKQGVAPSRSKHYKRQSSFKGSVREVRGAIIAILSSDATSRDHIRLIIDDDERFEKAMLGLVRDGLIVDDNGRVHLTS